MRDWRKSSRALAKFASVAQISGGNGHARGASTDDDGRSLCDLANLLVGLHDLFYPSLEQRSESLLGGGGPKGAELDTMGNFVRYFETILASCGKPAGMRDADG